MNTGLQENAFETRTMNREHREKFVVRKSRKDEPSKCSFDENRERADQIRSMSGDTTAASAVRSPASLHRSTKSGLAVQPLMLRRFQCTNEATALLFSRSE